jgi:hypothetical protein
MISISVLEVTISSNKMHHLSKKARGLSALAAAAILIYMATPVLADPLRSSNFVFQETSLGGTGQLSAQSANYQTLGTAGGILGLGTSVSNGYQFEGGNITTNDPALSFIVNGGQVSLGSFSAAVAATSTLTFTVLNYTAYGYVVQSLGTAPTNGSHTIANMSSTGPSQTGVEQYGINVVANTSPVSFGANPDHGQFGFGSAATNYNTPNNFRFVSGETIASAPKSSGQTTYTISYLVNVSSITPGGQYAGAQTVLVTGTY